jgi:hypothetical protein
MDWLVGLTALALGELGERTKTPLAVRTAPKSKSARTTRNDQTITVSNADLLQL